MNILRNSLLAMAIMLAASTFTHAQDEAGIPATPADTHAIPIGQLAESISTTTGLAISPLFVMGVLGAWKYASADEVSRAGLEWFCHPAIWITALVVSGLLLLKSTGKVVIPAPLVAPLDAMDHFIRNTAAPIAGISIAVPLSMKSITALSALNHAQEGVYHASALPIESLAGWGIATAVTLFIFTVVWMSFNAVDTLVMLCPFGPVELVSKISKGVILILIVSLATLSPILALILCAAIILLATMVAGWAYRLTVFGFVVLYDLFFPGSARKRMDLHSPHAFVKCAAKKIPSRTYGTISKENDGLIFRYKPVFFFPTRKVVLASSERHIVKGVLMSGLQDTTKTADFCKATFPPRYKNHEERLAEALGVTDIRDCLFIRGWKGFKLWFQDAFLEKSAGRAPGA